MDASTQKGSSFVDTRSTVPTSFTSGETSSHNKDAIAMNIITKENEPTQIDSPEASDYDGQSTLSTDSVILLTSQQRVDIVNHFSRALLRRLPGKSFVSLDKTVQMSEFRTQFGNLIKTYSKQVMEGPARRSRRRQASKAIRIVRNDILDKCYQALGGFNQQERRVTPSIIHQASELNLPELTPAEKVGNWNPEVTEGLFDIASDILDSAHLDSVIQDTTSIPPSDLGNVSDSSCNISDHTLVESNVSSHDETVNINAEDQDVYTYLTQHSAFSILIDELNALVERLFCDQNEIIHYRILLAVRRPNIGRNPANKVLQVEFETEWDFLGFLRSQHPSETMLDLGSVVITGSTVNAQLTTIDEYLCQTWPIHTWDLVNALKDSIGAERYCGEPDLLTKNIHVNLSDMKISVTGSDGFIVVVGQQLAWLGAVCRDSVGGLAHCYTRFTETTPSGHVDLTRPIFSLRYEVTPIQHQELSSCWNELVGDSVVASGFPIARREQVAIGLEISLEIMAALAQIPLATCFRGGYVLKGRSLAFVPVRRGPNFIQWHLFNKVGGRISYHELDANFPDRLSAQELDEDGLLTTRSFLGWCAESSCHLATNQYDYTSIRYTKTPHLSKRVVSLTGASVGFAKVGTGSLNFSISKKEAVHRADRAQYYTDLLDDAKQIPVVLQDMQDRRAWYTDGETAILHMILHRHALKPFGSNEKARLISAHPNKSQSVRAAMLKNVDVLVASDRDMAKAGIRSKAFKDIVGELYTMLEGMMSDAMDITEAGIELKLDWKKRVHGWEYMDLVNRKLKPHLREAELKATCGYWPMLIRDLEAIVLFGSCLQEVFRPELPTRLCKEFRELPKHKDFLAIQSIALDQMYIESGSTEEQQQLTLTGLQLHRARHLFERCPRSTVNTKDCKCERIQQLVPHRARSNIKAHEILSDSGVVIIGQGSSSWTKNITKSWEAIRCSLQYKQRNTDSLPVQTLRSHEQLRPPLLKPQPSNSSVHSGHSSMVPSTSIETQPPKLSSYNSREGPAAFQEATPVPLNNTFMNSKSVFGFQDHALASRPGTNATRSDFTNSHLSQQTTRNTFSELPAEEGVGWYTKGSDGPRPSAAMFRYSKQDSSKHLPGIMRLANNQLQFSSSPTQTSYSGRQAQPSSYRSGQPRKLSHVVSGSALRQNYADILPPSSQSQVMPFPSLRRRSNFEKNRLPLLKPDGQGI